ncbi:Siderophore iron transporter mirB [Golovinomyces cichoracearum]|uniref:Siderophore iron transporter mirB n=1 Tax=Golovinomyces cichoracearum TaxID=62708 RepID=A0A420IGI6_9PEZI|nr:Siderophore iron transporter mirB [Golovinomyces cichoracearum]
MNAAEIDQTESTTMAGVNKIEATARSWTRKELKMAYACIFLVYFFISLQQQIHFNVLSYVTSSFILLPLTGTTSIVSSIVGGVFRLATGKFIDTIGRPEGFILMTIFTTIGIIMMAATENVETFTAAQVFYWVGFDGMGYVMDVFMADTSSPKNRALVFAFSTTPYIITTFIGPRAAASFLRTSGWPWAYGVFAIITPVITIPLLYILYQNERKARKSGLLIKEKSDRTPMESISYYFFEFDGNAGFVLILLPSSLASYQRKGWGSGAIIAMLITGFTCFISFIIWEKKFARVSFIPFKLFRDPSIWGSCLLAMFLFISFFLWNNNFLPFLQVVFGLSITNAGYVSNVFSIGSCFWAIVFAGLIRVTGRFKYLALGHLFLQTMGVGLIIYFRQPKFHIGFIIMCQIFIAFGSGGLVISEQMTVIAACSHKSLAIPLALLALFSSVGGAIGTSISGAIFTVNFPQALERKLPGNATLNAILYGNLETQLSYPFGTPERNAVLYAYGETMWYQVCLGVAFLLPCFVFIAVWKDFKIKELKTNPGNLL